MLIPYGTVRRARRYPWANWSIAALNIVVYCYTVALLPDRFMPFVDTWAFRADRLDRVYTLFTMMWLHDPSSLLHLHLLGNLWALLVFGPQVEDALGSVRFACFYVAGGVLANLAQAGMLALAHVNASMPTIGASGAVMAVLGLFAVRFYSTPVKAVFIVVPGLRLPAVVFLALYVGLSDIRPGLLSTFAYHDASGVAHWAHIGGFLAGAAAGVLTGVVGQAKREYLVERPLEQGHDRRTRQQDLRLLLANGTHDPEAHLRLATLLDADEQTLKQASHHYAQAIRQFVLDGAFERVCAAYDAFCEGGHSFEDLDPEAAGAVAGSYERLGRKDAALYVFHHLATQPSAPPRLAEQALVRTAALSLDLGDRHRAAWALGRLREEYPLSAWSEWAERESRALGLP